MKKILILVVSVCVFLAFSMKAQAQEGNICHQHSEGCYERQNVTCTDGRIAQSYDKDFYCNTCQGIRSAKYTEEGYRCEYTGNYRVGFRAAFCWSCGGVVLNEPGLSEESHTRMGDVCICGYDETTVIAAVSLSQSTSEWTKENVVLSANVVEKVSGISLAPYIYQFSGGSANGNTCEVSENGTYTVTVMGANGQQTTANIQVSNIDKEPPAIAKCYVDKTYPEYSSATIIVESTDTLSGISENAYSFDGGKTFVKNNHLTITQNGNYTICVKDKAGNSATQTLAVSCFAKRPETTTVTEETTQVTEKSSEPVKETQTNKSSEKREIEPNPSKKENLQEMKSNVSLEKIPGVYSSLMKQNAENKAVPSFVGTYQSILDREENSLAETPEKVEEDSFSQVEKESRNVSFSQVSKGIVGGSVLLCIGMVTFLLVFLVKKL